MFSIRVDAYPGDGGRNLLRNVTSNLHGVNSIRRFASMFRMERSLDLKQAKFFRKRRWLPDNTVSHSRTQLSAARSFRLDQNIMKIWSAFSFHQTTQRHIHKLPLLVCWGGSSKFSSDILCCVWMTLFIIPNKTYFFIMFLQFMLMRFVTLRPHRLAGTYLAGVPQRI
jgi:hypothetical protein